MIARIAHCLRSLIYCLSEAWRLWRLDETELERIEKQYDLY
jgi:hypothetical protein